MTSSMRAISLLVGSLVTLLVACGGEVAPEENAQTSSKQQAADEPRDEEPTSESTAAVDTTPKSTPAPEAPPSPQWSAGSSTPLVLSYSRMSRCRGNASDRHARSRTTTRRSPLSGDFWRATQLDEASYEKLWHSVAGPPLSLVFDSYGVNNGAHQSLEGDALALLHKLRAKKRTWGLNAYRKNGRDALGSPTRASPSPR